MNAETLRLRIVAMYAAAGIPRETAIEVTGLVTEYTADSSKGYALNLAHDFVLLYEENPDTALAEFKARLID